MFGAGALHLAQQFRCRVLRPAYLASVDDAVFDVAYLERVAVNDANVAVLWFY